MSRLFGKVLGHHRVGRMIGAGGMGEVYEAEDLQLGRQVALKVLPAAIAADEERLIRFTREARILGSLNHPSIVTIFSVDQHEGEHFITMELVEGRTLAACTPPQGLPVARLLDVAQPLADALAAAHERGTVLIDPGGPPSGRVGLRKVLPRLGAPPRLNLMVITHGHFDHVGAASGLRDATGAPIAIHQADAAWLRAGQVVWPKGVTPWGRFARTVFGPVVMPLHRLSKLDPDLLIGDEGMDLEAYGISGRVVHTPGHSPGSVSVVLPSGEAFVGDLAMNGLPFCLRPRFGIFAHQPDRVADSWRKLLDLGAREIYPAHGRPFPTSALVS